MRVALVFPGQGSQRPGMGAPWRGGAGWELVDKASAALGRDLSALLLDADAETLRATREAQLSTLLVSLLALAALPEGLDVVAVAGHSLGEITALHAAGVLTADDALHLVAERGEAMQSAADAVPGTMAAVLGLTDEDVAEVCAGLPDVWPANANAPRHVVVSGTVAGVAAAGPALRAAGARRVLPLPVGGAFHTPLMAPARPRLEAALGRVAYSGPRVPVFSNVTARPHAPGAVAQRLTEQLTAPVLWRQTLEALPAHGVDTVVEVGPGGVLAGLATRTLAAGMAPADAPAGRRVLSVARPEDLEKL